MPISTLEAVDLLRFADVISERLGAAQAELGKKRGLDREKDWLNTAAQLVDEARAPGKGLVDRARYLPELSDLREEFAGALQNTYVDALEKLLAGITFHVSGRSPVIEALFPHQKFPPLRKAPRDVVGKFQRDLEKRAKSSYVSRMLSGEDFAFAVPVLEKLRASFAEYEACFGEGGLPEEEATALRQALIDAGEKIETVVRQAKLLAEAALVPLDGYFEQSGLGQKLKKRAARPPEAKPVVEEEPTSDELAATEAEADAAAVEEAEAPVVEAAPAPVAEEPAPVAKPARKKKAKTAAADAEAPTPEQAESQG